MNPNSERDARETPAASPVSVRREWVEPQVSEFDLNLAEQATAVP